MTAVKRRPSLANQISELQKIKWLLLTNRSWKLQIKFCNIPSTYGLILEFIVSWNFSCYALLLYMRVIPISLNVIFINKWSWLLRTIIIISHLPCSIIYYPIRIISHHMAFNPLKTKHRLLYLKTQFVPRSKHFSSLL